MPCLLTASGPRTGARFEIGAELVIGRSPSCEVSLPDDGKVSRRHAKLFARAEATVLADLGSRNGTFLNGDRVEGEVALVAGDRVQIGDTAFLFDPRIRASIDDSALEGLRAGAVEEFLPAAGNAAHVFRSATALLSCPSEAAALRRGAEEAMRAIGGDAGAAFLPGEVGLVTAAVVGASDVRLPRPLLAAAVERREAARAGYAAVVPLWAGGAAFGALFVQRADEPVREDELGLLGVIGRLCGEAVAAARARVPMRSDDVLIGSSRAFRKVVERARHAAGGEGSILLFGEAGSGKGLLGTFAHARSARAQGPAVEVDCRGTQATVEAELFGRGAGPSLPPQRSALFRADGGTLLLTKPEALSRGTSQRLARLLRERSAPSPDGGDGPSDVRVIAMSGDSLQRLAAVGRLDPDLAGVLAGTEVSVPPLRERKGDVPLLFDFFAGKASRAMGHRAPELSPEARDALGAYPWPGNVRELRLCAERLSLLCPGGEVVSAHLPREIQGGGLSDAGETLGALVARLERDVIAQALRRTRGKKIKAAALLGISRPTLDKKIALYRLAVR